MKKLHLSTIALCVTSLLVGCNDGSGFVSTAKPKTDTPAVVTETAVRNMSTDAGREISAIDADSPPAETVSNLFDGNKGTKFLTFSKNATVIFKASQAYELVSYNFISADDEPNRDPKNWVLKASNDANEWLEIDSQANQVFAKRGQLNSYEIEGELSAYQYYKFELVHGGTDSYGNDILQLAEIELQVKAKAPIVSYNVNDKTPEVDQFIIFKDTSLAGATSWEWQFEDGTPATSTALSPLVKFSSLGPKTVTLTASNDKGSTTLVDKNAIRVWDPATPWAGFPKPAVSYTKNLADHPGQLALERVMPDLTDIIHQISLGVAQILYTNVTEINVFETLNFETGEYDFPAAKSGTDKNMILYFDLNHLANLESKGDEALRQEIMGILWHELTHGYNNTPANGEYKPGAELHSYLEGLANYVRIKAGFLEHQRPQISWIDSWNEDAYNQTSFFLEWVANTNQNTDFIRLFNASANEIEEWSFDAAFKSIFSAQRGIDVVFAQYQQYLKNDLGLTPSYPTPVEGYRNFAQDAGMTVTGYATDVGIWGEGVDKTTDNNVKNKYNAIIEAPWWVAEHAPTLLPIQVVSSVDVDFSFEQTQLLNRYSIATGNDNPQRDPTSWQVFGSTDGANWQLIDTAMFPDNPARLVTYQFEVQSNTTAYAYYRFSFLNEQTGDGVGGDEGRLVQLGEIALLTKE
ncbi:hypothetical protein HJP15_05610 [Pseudoalteromonas sp. NEC-BIFX-2020_002]|uniref:PKD domain-containing protein n=1 Tax=Pseudoalteromonas porphyrae TaxID=187330 RepID=A0A0N1EST1_9GAMM|nr:MULTISPECIES: basic secretory protein-like protein [Pseudoalteromonas]KPH60207.1 hypothetical protein ADS77_16315 [Pseudoalteromonas porphyrae]NNG42420.1 hypothetical protein [Pseudoalteromonas sp. NEC-BIFX-2020_002]